MLIGIYYLGRGLSPWQLTISIVMLLALYEGSCAIISSDYTNQPGGGAKNDIIVNY